MEEPNGKTTTLRTILSIAATALISAAMSGGATFFTMASSVSRLDEKGSEHERRIIVLEAASYERTASMAALRTRQEGVERLLSQDDERLHRIEDKLDRVLEREKFR